MASTSEILPIPFAEWEEKCFKNREFRLGLGRLRSNAAREEYLRKHLLNDFASEYATTRACEAFAESFMFCSS